MNNRDFYSYEMDVTGTPEEQEAVYYFLKDGGVFDDEILEPCGPDDAPYSHYRGTTAENLLRHVYEWNEADQETLLHDIAVKVPGATIDIYGDCTDKPYDKPYGYHKRFHGDLYQESHRVSYIPPLKDGADIPFADRHTATPAMEAEPAKMYIFCEEKEDDSNIREFRILAISEDEVGLQKLLQAKVDMDEYGYIANYGVNDEGTNHFKTEYNESGFVEYYIFPQDVLSKEQLQETLLSPEYSWEFTYPDGFRDIVIEQVSDIAEDRGFGDIDIEKAADHFMADKKFQGMLKSAFWFDPERLSPASMNSAGRWSWAFIDEAVSENPNLFEDIGVIPEFRCPDNLREILINSIYDVARDNQMPVINAHEQADRYMHAPKFQNIFRTILEGIPHLSEESELYGPVSATCYNFVEVDMFDEEAHAKRLGLDDLIHSAKNKSQKERLPKKTTRSKDSSVEK